MLRSVLVDDDLLCSSGSQPLLSGHSHNVLQGGGLGAGSSMQEVKVGSVIRWGPAICRFFVGRCRELLQGAASVRQARLSSEFDIH